ncbi:hypothetical protein F0U60_41685 [Archangium minus]|uniref:Lipoprotein MlpA n=2 Tax=Archangium minus TaxID=83450 RepID=A0ABY9X3C4_9BACT|nr:hypothetical protein F0U60_41685 [Archangium minus]
MTMKRVSTVVAVLGAGLLVTACDIEQPSAGCVVQDSTSWIARYDVKEGQPTCAQPPPAGELVGVFKYRDPNKEDSNVLAMRPAGLASRGSRDPGDQKQQTAVGSLGSEVDANDFCKAASLSEASVAAASSATEDATQISYKFSNVEVYTAPRAPGTQLRADLSYTRDGCTTEVKVHAMWPAIGCTPGDADPAHNCGKGSKINPDMAVTCHPTLKICVPAKDVPSFVD